LGLSKDCPSVDIHDARPLPGSRTHHPATPPGGNTELSRAVWLPFGPSSPGLGLVPLLPFLPASAAFSARRSAGLLHPAADHGVRQVAGTAAWIAGPLPRDSGLFVPVVSVDTASRFFRSTAAPSRSRLRELASRGGSLGLPSVAGCSPGTQRLIPAHVPFPLAYYPSKSFPRRQPYRVTAASASSPFPCSGAPPASLPMLVSRDSGAGSTSRPCSIAESVASCTCCQTQGARYFLGLMVRQDQVPALLTRARAGAGTRGRLLAGGGCLSAPDLSRSDLHGWLPARSRRTW